MVLAPTALVLLGRYEKQWNLELNLQPVALGYVFQAASNRPPINVPNKAQMMKSEFALFCDLHKIPVSKDAWTLNMAAGKAPPDSRSLQRFLRVIQTERPEVLRGVSERLFHAIFGEGKNGLFKPSLHDLVDALGTDMLDEKTIDGILNKSEQGQKEINNQMKDEAKAYVDKVGIYGVPYMRVSNGKEEKTFMGSDRFELIAHWLGKPYHPSAGASKL